MVRTGEAEKLTVFVSYNHMDNRYSNFYITDIAARVEAGVNKRLVDMGAGQRVELWSDSKLIAGQQWRREIAHALNRSLIMLSFVTTRYCRSGECRLEYDGMTQGGYFIEGETGELELESKDFAEHLGSRVRPVVPILWERVDTIQSSLGASDDGARDFLQRLIRGQAIDVSSIFENNWMTQDARTENIVSGIVVSLLQTVLYVIEQAARTNPAPAPSEETMQKKEPTPAKTQPTPVKQRPTRAKQQPVPAKPQPAPAGLLQDIDPKFWPLEGSTFDKNLRGMDDQMVSLYLTILRFVDDLPSYDISLGPKSNSTAFVLKTARGDEAIFGSLRSPNSPKNKYFAINLKPGMRGFAYGPNGAELAPRESSSNKMFRNVTGVGHWGTGDLEIKVTQSDLENDMLPAIVREAIEDAAKAAYEA